MVTLQSIVSRGGATGYAVYATAYPALLRCTGVNIRILLKKKRENNTASSICRCVSDIRPAQ